MRGLEKKGYMEWYKGRCNIEDRNDGTRQSGSDSLKLETSCNDNFINWCHHKNPHVGVQLLQNSFQVQKEIIKVIKRSASVNVFGIISGDVSGNFQVLDPSIWRFWMSPFVLPILQVLCCSKWRWYAHYCPLCVKYWESFEVFSRQTILDNFIAPLAIGLNHILVIWRTRKFCWLYRSGQSHFWDYEGSTLVQCGICLLRHAVQRAQKQFRGQRLWVQHWHAWKSGSWDKPIFAKCGGASNIAITFFSELQKTRTILYTVFLRQMKVPDRASCSEGTFTFNEIQVLLHLCS